jgi:hypothetical protein
MITICNYSKVIKSRQALIPPADKRIFIVGSIIIFGLIREFIIDDSITECAADDRISLDNVLPAGDSGYQSDFFFPPKT